MLKDFHEVSGVPISEKEWHFVIMCKDHPDVDLSGEDVIHLTEMHTRAIKVKRGIRLDYREQHGCHDCVEVFMKHEYDEGSEYFCGFNAPKRPPCMSVEMDECPGLSSEANSVMHNADRAWTKWSKDREVRREGTCGSWTEGRA